MLLLISAFLPHFNRLKTKHFSSGQVQNHASKTGIWDRVVTSFREWQVHIFSLTHLGTILLPVFYFVLVFTVNRLKQNSNYYSVQNKQVRKDGPVNLEMMSQPVPSSCFTGVVLHLSGSKISLSHFQMVKATGRNIDNKNCFPIFIVQDVMQILTNAYKKISRIHFNQLK